MSYFHGGSCCGIRHIAGFPTSPDSFVSPRSRSEPANSSRCYKRPLPKQTGKERFDVLMEHIRAGQRVGIVEVVLADMTLSKQYTGWDEYIRKQGFVEIASSINSNTGNVVHVYHYYLDTPFDEFNKLQEEEHKRIRFDIEAQRKEKEANAA